MPNQALPIARQASDGCDQMTQAKIGCLRELTLKKTRKLPLFDLVATRALDPPLAMPLGRTTVPGTIRRLRNSFGIFARAERLRSAGLEEEEEEKKRAPAQSLALRPLQHWHP